MRELTTDHCQFSDCDFTAAGMNASQHNASAFTNGNFTYANLFGAIFRECKMIGSNFVETVLGGITIIGGDWSYVNLKQCSFKGLDLRKVRFCKADLFKCNFEKADLREADLTQAMLSGANFKEADLRDAKLDGIDIKSIHFSGTKIDITQAVLIAEAHGAVCKEF